MAAAQQLNRAGHTVTVLKRQCYWWFTALQNSNFKLKRIIDRRVLVLEAEGIVFKTNVNVGVNYSVEQLNEFDSIVLCGGSTESRSLPTKE
jgi:glutamate synthase (NADPH/NADH) small chain